MLALFVELRSILTPLLTPRLIVGEREAHLYWLDAIGCGSQWRFLLEASMAGLASVCRWLAGRALPWRFEFAHARPAAIEQYWVHLDEEVRFDCHVDCMRIANKYLHQTWSGGSLTAASVARREAMRQLAAQGPVDGLLGALQDVLERRLQTSPNLDAVAQLFGSSPATFKRKLTKHGTHFQQQLDLTRKRVALHLYRVCGYTNQQVADYLHFNDVTNLRRSFKRWTGLSPRALKQG